MEKDLFLDLQARRMRRTIDAVVTYLKKEKPSGIVNDAHGIDSLWDEARVAFTLMDDVVLRDAETHYLEVIAAEFILELYQQELAFYELVIKTFEANPDPGFPSEREFQEAVSSAVKLAIKGA